METPKKANIRACDCVNGVTYIGRSPGEKVGGRANYNLMDYIVVSTRKLTEVDVPYKSAAIVCYNNPKEQKFDMISLKEEHIVAVHSLETIEAPN